MQSELISLFLMWLSFSYKWTHTSMRPFSHTYIHVCAHTHIRAHTLKSDLTLCECLPGAEPLTKLPDLSNSGSSVQLGPNSRESSSLASSKNKPNGVITTSSNGAKWFICSFLYGSPYGMKRNFNLSFWFLAAFIIRKWYLLVKILKGKYTGMRLFSSQNHMQSQSSWFQQVEDAWLSGWVTTLKENRSIHLPLETETISTTLPCLGTKVHW